MRVTDLQRQSSVARLQGNEAGHSTARERGDGPYGGEPLILIAIIGKVVLHTSHHIRRPRPRRTDEMRGEHAGPSPTATSPPPYRRRLRLARTAPTSSTTSNVLRAFPCSGPSISAVVDISVVTAEAWSGSGWTAVDPSLVPSSSSWRTLCCLGRSEKARRSAVKRTE